MATTVTAVEQDVALVVAKFGGAPAPSGAYELRRLELKSECERILAEAKNITAIESAADEELVTTAGRALQILAGNIEQLFKPVKKQCDELKAPILAAEKELALPVEAEKKRMGTLQTQWNQKLRREQEERDRIAREEAEKQAREEALQRAIEAEESGDEATAEAILEEPIIAPAVVLSQAPSKPAGAVGGVVDYKAKVTDLKALVRAVAEGTAPIQCLTVNESFLNSQAKAFKDAFGYPGVVLEKTERAVSYRR